jgi:predicted aspartyl protease
MPVEVPPTEVGTSTRTRGEGVIPNRESAIRSKILFHFIKGRISLTPMETVMMIPGELEQLENLVKVARRKKEAEIESTQVSLVSSVPTLRKICVNKTHSSKTLHLAVEINNCLIEGLVDTGASMSVMAVAIVKELGLMHLVSGSETYKTASSTVTQALGRIKEVQIKVGGVQCNMTFMVVDTDSYDVLLGLDLLIKIGAIMDVEQGLIQVRRGPGNDVEVLPLTMVNLVQRSDSKNSIHGKCMSTGSRTEEESLYWNVLGANPRMATQESESEADSGDDPDEGSQSEVPVQEESEFEDTTLDNLIRSEGPQQILQLTLQSQTNNLMREEIADADDYADWIRWAADGENRRMNPSESTNATGGSVVLQVLQEESTATIDSNRERITDDRKSSERWEDISQKLRIDQGLDELKRQYYGGFSIGTRMCLPGTKGS